MKVKQQESRYVIFLYSSLSRCLLTRRGHIVVTLCSMLTSVFALTLPSTAAEVVTRVDGTMAAWQEYKIPR